MTVIGEHKSPAELTMGPSGEEREFLIPPLPQYAVEQHIHVYRMIEARATLQSRIHVILGRSSHHQATGRRPETQTAAFTVCGPDFACVVNAAARNGIHHVKQPQRAGECRRRSFMHASTAHSAAAHVPSTAAETTTSFMCNILPCKRGACNHDCVPRGIVAALAATFAFRCQTGEIVRHATSVFSLRLRRPLTTEN
jgi:hypothetical protein